MQLNQTLDRATTLARRCAGDRVPENFLAMVLAHLQRHRDVKATLRLLSALQRSPYRNRTNSTPGQLKNLETHVTAAIASASNWEEAAWIVGWARRLARGSGGRT